MTQWVVELKLKTCMFEKNNKDGKLSYSEIFLSCVHMYKYLQMHMWLHVNTEKEKQMMWITVKTVGLWNTKYRPSTLCDSVQTQFIKENQM